MGPLGCPISGGHGHADLLSIQCSVFGEPYIVDAGTYCYSSHPQWRDFFRSTAAHSTVRVDGQEQAVSSGPFKWRSRPRVHLRRWLSNESLDFADADHDAYQWLPGGVRHRRRVMFVKPRYWVVVDEITGGGRHRVECGFQFAPREVTLRAHLWAVARGRTGHGLLIRPFATVALEAKIFEGDSMPIHGWVSSNYGRRMPAPLLVYAADAILPLRIVTLLFPLDDVLAPAPDVSPVDSDAAGPLALRFTASGEYVRVDPHEVVIPQSQRPHAANGN